MSIKWNVTPTTINELVNPRRCFSELPAATLRLLTFRKFLHISEASGIKALTASIRPARGMRVLL